MSASQAANNRLPRTVMHKVPRHVRQCAAAEPALRTSRSRQLSIFMLLL